MASGSDDETVQVWSMKERTELYKVEHDDKVWCVKFHGDVLISSSDDKTVKLWDRKDGKLLHTLRHDDWCYNFDVRDNLLVVGADDGVYIWSLNDRRQLKKIDLEEVNDVRIQGRKIIAACWLGGVYGIKME